MLQCYATQTGPVRQWCLVETGKNDLEQQTVREADMHHANLSISQEARALCKTRLVSFYKSIALILQPDFSHLGAISMHQLIAACSNFTGAQKDKYIQQAGFPDGHPL
jgi:hypothetical protein